MVRQPVPLKYKTPSSITMKEEQEEQEEEEEEEERTPVKTKPGT